MIPRQYVSTTSRIAYVKTSERTDALGTKLVFTGVLEDSTFKAPFVSHRISYPIIRNSVYKFYSAYVHEFEDKSLLLVVTEHTKIEPKNIEDYREFVWTPKIESIKRPVHYIALLGVITTVHSNSGLVRRCNECKSILHDSCPNNCNEDWGWDLRISSRLYDGSGSIKMILTTFTYPPSMCFFAGGDSLVIPAGVQKFIESKKSTLKTRMDEVANKAMRDLRFGDLCLGSATITEQKADLQTQLLQETRQRLFGRNVSAWGSILTVHDELWFFPNQIRFS